MEGQTAAGQGQVRGWLLLPETRRFGRRSRPLTFPKALTPSGSRLARRRQSASRTTGLHKEDQKRKDQPAEEEEGRDFDLPKEQETTRLEEIIEDR